MKTLHFECFAGISGDMALGALVDLGVDPGDIRRELGKLGIGGWKLDFAADQRNGIGGTHAVVELEGTSDHIAHDDDPQYHYRPVYAGDYVHTGGHSHEHSREHAHNSWKEIRALIEGSKISEGAKKRALDIFSRIARAEAKVHGFSPEDVAFHEVGALDSIIDIVGTAVCLDILKPDRVTCTEIELGGGTVKCAHGILPVPAPATLLLVQGLPVRTGGFNKEMTTPTGAAILASSVDEFVTGPVSFRELKTGVGIGTRKMERPNVLRVSWRETPEALPQALAGEAAGSRPWKIETLVLVEANIDDMTGEALGFLMERLFEAGALDVSFGSILMKKSRPGTLVSVLARPGNLDILRECLFRNSTTIGFREIPVNRVSLPRREGSLKGDFGSAGFKTAFLGDERLRAKIEFEDRARLAREQGVSLDEAERIILRPFGGELPGDGGEC
ncbi:MAG: nickel pincer cofactor biosynthesis protein LarC [Treponema sp.]|nr:nickel pincer cofactor biosynthesis protein LarC [Treponema sp.]